MLPTRPGVFGLFSWLLLTPLNSVLLVCVGVDVFVWVGCACRSLGMHFERRRHRLQILNNRVDFLRRQAVLERWHASRPPVLDDFADTILIVGNAPFEENRSIGPPRDHHRRMANGA